MEKLITFTVAVGIAIAATTVAQETDYADAVRKAEEMGQWAEVNRVCREWAAARPDDDRPRTLLGQALVRAGFIDQALEQFELAVEANPLSPTPHHELGTLFLKSGELDLAERAFRKALKLQREHVGARIGQARVALKRGRAQDALAVTEAILEGTPGNTDAQALQGACLLELGQTERAHALLIKATETAALDPDLLYEAAKACELAGQAREAQERWRQFLRIEPTGERADRVRQGWVVLDQRHLDVPGPRHPCWSPDGKRIMAGWLTLRLVNIADGTVKELRDPAGLELRWHDWAPDGRHIVASRKTREKVAWTPCIFELGEDDQLKITDENFSFGLVHAKFCPPEGRELLVSYPTSYDEKRFDKPIGAVMTYDLTTRKLTEVPCPKETRWGRNSAAPGPDGQAVVYHVWEGKTGEIRELAVVKRGNPDSQRIVTEEGLHCIEPAISPDSRSIAYKASDTKGNHLVRLVSLDGAAGPVTLGSGWAPGWSPDGRQLAYGTQDSGLVIVRLGGLAGSSVHVDLEGSNTGLVVRMTNLDTDVKVSAVADVFDHHSVRLVRIPLGDEAAHLRHGEVVESMLATDALDWDRASSIRITAICSDGRRSILLRAFEE